MTLLPGLLECRAVTADRVRLQIDRVSKTYGSRRVLRPVSAELRCSDTLLVTGHNGVGKSTLLRIISGLLRQSEGAVQYWQDGVALDAATRRRAFGFVGPDLRLYRELTAREHLEFVGRLRGLPRHSVHIETALEMVGLGGRADLAVSAFSSGMVQRLRYALALMPAPRVLVLDEPTTNLDDEGVKMVGRIVEMVARDGIVVIATNDPRDQRYGELVLALDQPADG